MINPVMTASNGSSTLMMEFNELKHAVGKFAIHYTSIEISYVFISSMNEDMDHPSKSSNNKSATVCFLYLTHLLRV